MEALFLTVAQIAQKSLDPPGLHVREAEARAPKIGLQPGRHDWPALKRRSAGERANNGTMCQFTTARLEARKQADCRPPDLGSGLPPEVQCGLQGPGESTSELIPTSARIQRDTHSIGPISVQAGSWRESSAEFPQARFASCQAVNMRRAGGMLS